MVRFWRRRKRKNELHCIALHVAESEPCGSQESDIWKQGEDIGNRRWRSDARRHYERAATRGWYLHTNATQIATDETRNDKRMYYEGCEGFLPCGNTQTENELIAGTVQKTCNNDNAMKRSTVYWTVVWRKSKAMSKAVCSWGETLKGKDQADGGEEDDDLRNVGDVQKKRGGITEGRWRRKQDRTWCKHGRVTKSDGSPFNKKGTKEQRGWEWKTGTEWNSRPKRMVSRCMQVCFPSFWISGFGRGTRTVETHGWVRCCG